MLQPENRIGSPVGRIRRETLAAPPPPHSSVKRSVVALLLNVAECQKAKFESATACSLTGCTGSLM